jgi:hypothetical protein
VAHSSKYSLGVDKVTKRGFFECKRDTSSDDYYWDPNNYNLASSRNEPELEKSEPWKGGKLFRITENEKL